MRQAFHWANLALAFALELCALAALCYWGFSVGGGPVAKAALGIGAPLCAAVLWGLFAAPRAPVSVPLLGPGTKLLVFGRRPWHSTPRVTAPSPSSSPSW